MRLDHFNRVAPDVSRSVGYMEDLGFRTTKQIIDSERTVYAAWMQRKPTVHDTALTGGVSNAFYLYLRDPDGHRVEDYTQDYYTGDPDNPVVSWDVHDNQRRDFWGNPQPVKARTDESELEATLGADGFSYTRPEDKEEMLSWKQGKYKLGHEE